MPAYTNNRVFTSESVTEGHPDKPCDQVSDAVLDTILAKRSLAKELAEIKADEVSPDQMLRISELLDDWDNTEMDSKRAVVDALIDRVSATSENVDISWKI